MRTLLEASINLPAVHQDDISMREDQIRIIIVRSASHLASGKLLVVAALSGISAPSGNTWKKVPNLRSNDDDDGPLDRHFSENSIEAETILESRCHE